jgi:hypothetical protein
MAAVHYFLQDESKKELYMYMIEGLAQDQVKFKDVIRTFPESGRFHFRFRIAMPEERSTVAVWMDYFDPESQVPLFKGNIIVKALQLPPFSNTRLLRHSSKRYKTGLSELYRKPSPAKARPAAKEVLRRASPTRPPEPAAAPVKPTESVASESNPTQQQEHKPKPPLSQEQKPQPPPDMISWSPFKAVSQETSFFPATATDPTNGKSEAELRAEKKQQVKQAVDDKVDDYKRRMADEEQQKLARLKSREQLGEMMDRWETRNMQKNNIRALLSTVHTVLWPGANWPTMSMSQVLAPAGVKRGYQIAMLRFHPDKHNNDPPDVKYICERVFSALNEAWKVFLSENQSV